MNAAVEPSANIAYKPFENTIFDMRGLLRILDDLALVERSLFRGKEGLISEKARDYTSGSILLLFEEIEKIGLEPASDKKQLEFIKDLVIYLKSLPLVKLTLAFSPTNTFIEKISGQVSAQLGKKTLLDILVNEYVVGGAIFEYNGKISKQTLDTQLEVVLAKYVG